ncbi:MAG: T9SS type A sorting domain-containing protein [Candidatus Marinimicrobia bacterium]|nr:T9SS type A sorting domain-containing protein [Candidatus Neomarinimicrobiota bacterium]
MLKSMINPDLSGKKLSLVLGFMLIIGLVTYSGSLFAFAGGDGTFGNPYQVSNATELNDVRNYLSSHFIQTADIDISGYSNWDPIGNSSTEFTGNYNGDGHNINGLTINRSTTDYIGLFGYTNGATIQNLGVTNVNITGDNYVGGLVGRINSSSTVSNCYSTGSVSGSRYYVGGLLGYSYSSSTVSNCYSTSSVTGTGDTGGFVGRVKLSSKVSNCYSRGNVTRSTGSSSTNLGGFCGYNESATIEYCYSTGSVSYDGATDPTTKGFVGGNSDGTYTNNFWDSEASNQSSATGATGKTTSQMKTQSTFTDAGWDFEVETANGTNDYWNMDYSGTKNNGYPYLSWEDGEDVSLPVTLSSFTAKNRSGGVLLEWVTESEIENLGFLIEKQILDAGYWTEIASYLSNTALEGHGSTTEAHEYQFTDSAVQPGVTYEYRLGDVDYSGKVTWHDKIEIKVKAEDGKIPTEFGLQRAYPNPFNPTTTISYQLASASFVKISIYDVRGKLVEILVNEQKDRGSYSVVWDAGGLSSGTYLYKIAAGEYTGVNKCLLIR